MTLLNSTLLAAGLACPAIALADDPNLTTVQTPAPEAALTTAAPAGSPGVDEDGIDIRIDFGTSSGVTLPGQWNNIDNYTGVTSDLIDFNSGMPTSASIDGLGGAWRSFVADVRFEFPEQDWFVQPAAGDAAGLSADLSASYLISGLPDGEYTVEVIAARSDFDYLNTFTIGDDLATRTFLGTPVVTPWGAASHGLADGNWLIWDGVAADGGTIQLDLQAGPGTLGILNAMRISMTGGGCRADIDGDGSLTLFDFLEFQNLFDAGDLAADFDGDGVLTLFDFLEFQNEFDAGCE